MLILQLKFRERAAVEPLVKSASLNDILQEKFVNFDLHNL